MLAAAWAHPGANLSCELDLVQVATVLPDDRAELGPPEDVFGTLLESGVRKAVVRAFWRLFVAAALCESGTGHHLHFWFSKRVRAWLPIWIAVAEKKGETDLIRSLQILRQRIQDVVSLGINLRRREAWELNASLDDLEENAAFRSPKGCEESSLLWTLSLAFAAASWAGRNLPRAIGLLQGRVDRGPEAAGLLSMITGALYGEAYFVEEFRQLGRAEIKSELKETEKKLKREGVDVDQRADGFLGSRRSG